jgi:hypothetical protein
MGIRRNGKVVSHGHDENDSQEAVAAVKARRGIVSPDIGFQKQLVAYARFVHTGLDLV